MSLFSKTSIFARYVSGVMVNLVTLPTLISLILISDPLLS